MKIWIDLANSPHVPFFAALIPAFRERGHEVAATSRDFAQTVELAEKAGLETTVIGGHGGASLRGKARNIAGRAWELARWAHGRGFGVAVSHNSYAHVAAARWLGVRSVTLMDYEHQPANHLAFRLASRVIVPRAFPAAALRKFGAKADKVRFYDGLKEDVYLADFAPDPRFADELRALGVGAEHVLVVVRPPAQEALYHRFENELFDELLSRLRGRADVRAVILPRTAAQRELYQRPASDNFIFPERALDGANLIAHSDLIVSAGGTMNREAAALGVPAATIYAGRWAAIDEWLVGQGRLRRLATKEDLDALPLCKKRAANARRAWQVKAEVTGLILAEP
jgi:predicted glycosyltransferase